MIKLLFPGKAEDLVYALLAVFAKVDGDRSASYPRLARAFQFDPNRKISDQDWATIEQALLLTPSSGGLQPWKFIVVTDPAVRAKLLPASYGQAQITNASHLVVFAAKQSFSEGDVDAFIRHTAATRGVPVESLAAYRDMLVGGIVKSMDEPARDAWARNQAYIALGNLTRAFVEA